MTTYVLVHGAWHGPWAWERLVPHLHRAGARTLTPALTLDGDAGLHDHAAEVVACLREAGGDEVVLVGHSYAGLVVREAADAHPDPVSHLVLVDAWAGGDGAGMLTLAPAAFTELVLAAARTTPGGLHIPAPPPASFGITDPGDARRLAERLRPHPLRTFTHTPRLCGARHRSPGTALYCRPQTYPFDRMAAALGYRTVPIDGPNDVMLTLPEAMARHLVRFGNEKLTL